MQNEKLNNYKNNHKIIDSIADLHKGVSEDKHIDVLSQSGGHKSGGLLESINRTENANFNKWFTGSTNSYEKVVARYDPNKTETVTNDQWDRQIVNGTPFHQKPIVIAESQGEITGGRRRKKSRKKSSKKSSKKARKKIKNKLRIKNQ